MKYGGLSGGSLLSGGGIIIFRVIRMHFLDVPVDPAVRGRNYYFLPVIKCLLITGKIMIPPPDSGDPPDGPPYFTKKTFPPDRWDPPATSSHARKCVRAKKRFAP